MTFEESLELYIKECNLSEEEATMLRDSVSHLFKSHIG